MSPGERIAQGDSVPWDRDMLMCGSVVWLAQQSLTWGMFLTSYNGGWVLTDGNPMGD